MVGGRLGGVLYSTSPKTSISMYVQGEIYRETFSNFSNINNFSSHFENNGNKEDEKAENRKKQLFINLM